MPRKQELKNNTLTDTLPAIPNKRYFTIGEAGDLCGVKPHVLRYWEQEFTQLKPTKRRGNRRYYQHKDVILVRKIRHLLYEKGYTIGGARKHLADLRKSKNSAPAEVLPEINQVLEPQVMLPVEEEVAQTFITESSHVTVTTIPKRVVKTGPSNQEIIQNLEELMVILQQ